MADLAAAVAAIAEETEDVALVTSRRAAEQVETAEETLRDAERRQGDKLDQPEVVAARQALTEAVEAATPHVLVVKLRNIGRTERLQLQREHPPTEEHRKEFGRGIGWNPETYPVAAIAAAMVEPSGATVESVEALADKLSEGEFQKLWNGYLSVNVGVTQVPKSLASSLPTASSATK